MLKITHVEVFPQTTVFKPSVTLDNRTARVYSSVCVDSRNKQVTCSQGYTIANVTLTFCNVPYQMLFPLLTLTCLSLSVSLPPSDEAWESVSVCLCASCRLRACVSRLFYKMCAY